MKKYLALLILPLFLFGAAYKSREVNQNWKFDDPQALDLLDPLSGKWVIYNAAQTGKTAAQPAGEVRGFSEGVDQRSRILRF